MILLFHFFINLLLQIRKLKSLLQITKFALVNNFTVIAAMNLNEAARYIETYKIYQHKTHVSISVRLLLAVK